MRAACVFAGLCGASTSAQTVALPLLYGPQLQAVKNAGSVSGTVLDTDKDFVEGARVTLTSDADGVQRHAVADVAGLYRFGDVPAGAFRLTFAADGFASAVALGSVTVGQEFQVPAVTLEAGANFNVQVSITPHDLAETEIKYEEKQRLIGIIPNFYVVYDWHAPPLSRKQKFELAYKTLIDPVNLMFTAGVAGIEQATDEYPGYHQGAAGFGKRLGASTADFAIGAMVGGAVLPVLFRQDPRYFYKGHGSVALRFFYALSTAVIAKGDNGKWQPSYSGLLGNLVSGAASNLYYPASDRHGVSLTFINAGIGAGFDGVSNVFQEFLLKHFTKGVPDYGSGASPVAVKP